MKSRTFRNIALIGTVAGLLGLAAVSPAGNEYRSKIAMLIVTSTFNMPNATAAANGIILGTDTALYRSAANTIGTPDAFTSAGVVTGDDVAATDDVTAGDDLVATDDAIIGDDLVVTDAITAASVTTTAAILSSGTAGVGYTTGAGGTVTQQLDKSTTVVLSKRSGTITMNNATLNSATVVSFTCTNTTVSATDYVAIQHESGGTVGAYTVTATPGSGSFVVNVRNNTAGNLGEALVLRFVVFEGVTS